MAAAKSKSKNGLKTMKIDTANELGLSGYDSMDKGNLTARQNGYVGGLMVKKMIEMAERQLSGR